MNTYEITFTRENGSTGKDRITAANEKQARKDFREIYRHSSATITDVIVVAENVPASKQQERDALDQIRAIVDTLGPDSYLATAFAGCFEDAEENIKNDFACSMKQRLESAEAKRIEAELGYNRLVDKLAESEKALEAARADIEKKDEEIAALNARIATIQRPAEPAEISDELLADLATFSSVYIERIQKAIIENAGQIAKNATLVRLLHQYSTRLEQERIEYAREVYNCAKHGTEFRPSNKCLTHASSYEAGARSSPQAYGEHCVRRPQQVHADTAKADGADHPGHLQGGRGCGPVCRRVPDRRRRRPRGRPAPDLSARGRPSARSDAANEHSAPAASQPRADAPPATHADRLRNPATYCQPARHRAPDHHADRQRRAACAGEHHLEPAAGHHPAAGSGPANRQQRHHAAA
ncbi:hypothetical protein [Gemmiger formicilis]